MKCYIMNNHFEPCGGDWPLICCINDDELLCTYVGCNQSWRGYAINVKSPYSFSNFVNFYYISTCIELYSIAKNCLLLYL